MQYFIIFLTMLGMYDTDALDGLSNGNGRYENMQIVAVSQQCRDMAWAKRTGDSADADNQLA